MTLVFEHIAARLDISVEEAEERCRLLLDELRSELDEVGRSALPGIGTFVRSGSELRFEPEARLATVVNHRFAGLYPIPVEREGGSGLDFESAFGVPDIPIAADVAPGFEESKEDSEGAAAIARPDEPRGAADRGEATDPAASDDVEGADADDVERLIYVPEDVKSDADLAGGAAWARSRDVVESVRTELELSDEADELLGESGAEEATETDSGAESDAEPTADLPEADTRTGSWNRPATFDEPVNPDQEEEDDFAAESDFASESDEPHDFGDSLVHPPTTDTGIDAPRPAASAEEDSSSEGEVPP
ncbi:MAG: hypothetical protein R3178_08825, partial [Rhodothermales bacterium]|nr:hypothetical protein [Rhodothermales bacterium]